MITVTVERVLDNPKEIGKKITRKANVQTIAAGTYDDKGNLVAGSVTLDTLLTTFGSLENIAEFANSFVEARARSIAYNELGKADETSKKIKKAIDALRNLPGFGKEDVSDEAMLALVMQSPKLQAEVNAANVTDEISLTVDLERLTTDKRGRPAEETAQGDEQPEPTEQPTA